MTKKEAIKRLKTDFAGTDLLKAVQTAMKMPELVKGYYRGTYALDIYEVPYGGGSYLLHAFFVQEEVTYTVHTDIYVGEALQHHYMKLDLSQDIDRQMLVFDGELSELCAEYDEEEETPAAALQEALPEPETKEKKEMTYWDKKEILGKAFRCARLYAQRQYLEAERILNDLWKESPQEDRQIYRYEKRCDGYQELIVQFDYLIDHPEDIIGSPLAGPYW